MIGLRFEFGSVAKISRELMGKEKRRNVKKTNLSVG